MNSSCLSSDELFFILLWRLNYLPLIELSNPEKSITYERYKLPPFRMKPLIDQARMQLRVLQIKENRPKGRSYSPLKAARSSFSTSTVALRYHCSKWYGTNGATEGLNWKLNAAVFKGCCLSASNRNGIVRGKLVLNEMTIFLLHKFQCLLINRSRTIKQEIPFLGIRQQFHPQVWGAVCCSAESLNYLRHHLPVCYYIIPETEFPT